MRILFIQRLYSPHIGGVEKQSQELNKQLLKRGFEVSVITYWYDKSLREKENVDGVYVIRINYPKIKFLGLFFIWFELFKRIGEIKKSDIVHAHGSFIWYWPFRFIFPKKPVYVTFHGWEGIYPIPWKNKLIRKIDALLAWKNITIHDYVEKYYGIKADKISYTAVDLPKRRGFKKNRRKLLYVGRLDVDTGLNLILQALDYVNDYDVDFCGDGPLKNKCKKYGKVHGFVNPNPYLEEAFICLSPGVTSILEAFTYKCLVVTTYNNFLKRDYLLMTPFSKWIKVGDTPKALAKLINYYLINPNESKSDVEKAYEWVKTQNWDNELKRYLDLWGIKEK